MPQPTGMQSNSSNGHLPGTGDISSFIHSLFHLTLFFCSVLYAVSFTLGLRIEISVFKSIPTTQVYCISTVC